MSQMFGADSGELRRLAAEFSSTADEIDRESRLLTQMLGSVEWIGRVASVFSSGWAGVQVPRMGVSTTFLREAAQRLERNAQEQDLASSAVGGTTTATTHTSGPRAEAWSGGAWGGPGGGFSGPQLSPSFGSLIERSFGSGGGTEFRGQLVEGSIASHEFADGRGSVTFGSGEAGIGVNDGVVGAYGEVSVMAVGIEDTVAGSDRLGVSAGAQAQVGTASGTIGYRDGSVGAVAEASLIHGEVSGGVNLLGRNVSLSLGAGVSLGIGAEVGSNNRLSLGPFTAGLSFR